MAKTISDEKLSCFLDGELPPEEIEQIEEACRNDPGLQSRLEALSRADTLWREALLVVEDDIPQSVMDILHLTEPNPANDNLRFGKWLTPIAASVAFALGLAVQSVIPNSAGQSDNIVLAGQIQSSNPLFAVLEKGPSSRGVELKGSTDILAEPILTFATIEGGYCREYIVESETFATRNIACRSNDSWEVLITSRTNPRSNDQYKTVGAESDQAIDAVIDNLISGIPLDSDAERNLLEGSWKENRDKRE